MTSADFKRIALSLDGSEEGSHMGAVDFRVGGKIFATLASEKLGYGNLMYTPQLQTECISTKPDLFLPIAGGWGRKGCTHIRLAKASEKSLTDALRLAWQLRLEKNEASKSRSRHVKSK